MTSKQAPDPRIARRANWPVGQLYSDPAGIWRWDGESFRPLAIGDVCPTGDPLLWQRWDGSRLGWRELRIAPGALVSVTVNKTWVQMDDATCTVLALHLRNGFWHAQIHQSWCKDAPVELPVELMTPLAGAEEFRTEPPS